MAAAGPRKPSRAAGHIDARQLSLDHFYEIPQPPAPVAGSLDYSAELCAILADGLALARADHGLSREMVAARMSELTGDQITKAMLDVFTAESHVRHRFPFEYAAAFEAATGSFSLQLLLARKRGTLVLAGDDAVDARLGQVRRKMAQLKEEERRLTRQIGRDAPR